MLFKKAIASVVVAAMCALACSVPAFADQAEDTPDSQVQSYNEALALFSEQSAQMAADQQEVLTDTDAPLLSASGRLTLADLTSASLNSSDPDYSDLVKISVPYGVKTYTAEFVIAEPTIFGVINNVNSSNVIEVATITNASGKEVSTWALGGGKAVNTLVSNGMVLPKGVYTVTLKLANKTRTTYTAQLGFVWVTMDDDTNVEIEDNTDIDEATDLPINTTFTGTMTLFASESYGKTLDSDTYKVTLNGNSALKMRLYCPGDAQLAVLDENENILTYGLNASGSPLLFNHQGSSSTKTYDCGTFPAGTYYVRVISSSADAYGQLYDITAKVQCDWNTFGTCEWRVVNGDLQIRPINDADSGKLDNIGPISEAPWADYASSITSVTITGDVHANTYLVGAFEGMSQVETIDVGNLDTSETVYMNRLFEGCSSLTGLKNATGGSFDTSKVQVVSFMFADCTSLSGSPNVAFDLSSVTSANSMFENCAHVEKINLNAYDTPNLTNCESMFKGCSELKTVDITGLSSSKLTECNNMFADCSSLTTIYDDGTFDAAKVTNAEGMFTGCSSLAGGAGTSFSEDNVDGSYAHVDTTTNPGYFTDSATWQTFGGCEWRVYRHTLYIQPANGAAEGTLGNMFGVVQYSDVSYDGYCPWAEYAQEITDVQIAKGVKAGKDLSDAFLGCKRLTSIDLSNMDTSGCVYADDLLSACTSLESVNLSNNNLSNLKALHAAFRYDSALTSVSLPKTGLGSLNSASNMFMGCTSLKSLDLSGINPSISSNNTQMMFTDASALSSIVLPAGLDLSTTDLLSAHWVDSNDRYYATTSDMTSYNASRSGSALTYSYTYTSKNVTRLAGANAYDTMTKIVNTGFEAGSCETVIVATFSGYWDALSASGLAGMLECPVLLTDKKQLSDETRSEIVRLGAKNVVIVGGTAAVSANVASAIRAMGLTVTRYAGANACATAIEIFNAGQGYWGDTCVVATSGGYWDALAASPYSYAMAAPIFLTNSDGSISADTLEAMQAGGFTRVIIAGGPAVIGEATAKTITSATGAQVLRVFGQDACETSSALAQFCISEGMNADKFAVATVNGYWDAVTGAALCGKNSSPLVLAGNGNTKAIATMKSKYAADIDKAYVFGGESAISASVYTVLDNIWNQ